ncbi:hypothetical protein AX14_006253 [Amanita brunnescens Koide BX004]|nr:hypothetical protein AX14_006253 [Amanita brunnescens Koide BX004]
MLIVAVHLSQVDANYTCMVAMYFIGNVLAGNLDILNTCMSGIPSCNRDRSIPVDQIYTKTGPTSAPNCSQTYAISTTFEHWTQRGSKHTIEIKEHGTSAKKGKYYIVAKPGDDEG